MGWWRCQSQVVCRPVAARAEAENRTKAAARQMVSLNELNGLTGLLKLIGAERVGRRVQPRGEDLGLRRLNSMTQVKLTVAGTFARFSLPHVCAVDGVSRSC